jgi:hypothetical protein
MGYLTETAEAGKYDLVGAVQDLAAKGGPGVYRQAFDLVRLALGRQGVRPEEYFTYAIWRKDRGRKFLKGFLPNWRKRAFNDSLKMPARGLADDILNDKIATEALLAARGLPVTRTRALYGTGPAPDLPGLRLLRSADDIAAFLSDPRNLPVFGKPRNDSFARGSAMIEGPAGPGTVRFLTGREVPIAGLAAEIVSDWTGGYLFQPHYQCEASLRRHVGPAMASVRIVTLWTDSGIEPWYAVIRLPARSAMHDGDADDERIWGLIDVESGRIAKLRILRDPLSADLTHGNDPTAPFLGFTLPHWQAAVSHCRAGHESFPGHGIIGWDVFLTDEGALLNEANVNPGHVYQVAAQRPLLNPDLRPAYDRAVAFARKHGGGIGAF